MLIIVVQPNVFFWDSVMLSSQQPTWYFNHGFFSLLPSELDSGHPPGWAWYMAAVWHIFGRSLVVSHWAMWPWLWLFLVGFHKLIGVFSKKRNISTILIIALSAVPMLSLATSISPDMAIMGGLVWGLYGVFKGRHSPIFYSSILLVSVSLRGSVVLLAIFLVHFIASNENFKPKIIYTYLAVFILVIAYYTCHYVGTGWVLSHAASPWAGHRNIVDINSIAKNLVVLLWRCVDYGLIAFVLLTLWIFYYRKSQAAIYFKTKILLQATIIFFIVFCIAFVPFSNPIGHRYILPIALLVSMFGVISLVHFKVSKLRKNLILGSVVIMSLSGVLWQYPANVAKGWDSNLSVFGYSACYNDVNKFIVTKKIKPEQISTVFPNIASASDISLSGGTISKIDMQAGLGLYHWYISTSNDYEAKHLDSLRTYYRPMIAATYYGQIQIYSKRNERHSNFIFGFILFH